MQVRPITREELEQAKHIHSTAFIFVRGEPDPEDQSWRQIRGAFDQAGTMTACVIDAPFIANLNGHMVGMCGIGGVATLPEYRRQGYVRALMSYILKDAYARGDVYSTLYPFSFPYYRKFGYEIAETPYDVSIPMEQMAHYRPFGSVREFVAGDDMAPYRQVYNAYIAQRNFACDRDVATNGRALWENWLSPKHNPGKTREYAYLWRDEDGTPGAFALVHPKGQGHEGGFQVYDYAYASPRALRGMLGFLRLLEGQAARIMLRLPDDLSPHHLFPEPYNLTVTSVPRGMVRLINVQKALETLGGARLTGEVTIGVTDEMLPENSGVWHVVFADGKTTVEKTGHTAEWTVSIGLLSQLVSGVMCFDQATYVHDFGVSPERAEWLAQVFPQRKRALVERF